jgi:PleD family two-component response regulator
MKHLLQIQNKGQRINVKNKAMSNVADNLSQIENAGENGRILVADDEEFCIASLKVMLTKA